MVVGIATASLLGLTILAVVSYPVLVMFGPDVYTTTFDAEVWKATPSEFSHESMRLRMVDDFLASHAPVGKSRGQVEALLGPPDDTPYFDEYDMVYHLGAERAGIMSIDSEWLVFSVDDSGRVTGAWLVTD